jgi:glycosyltransferase involved in cell wall biosynthesis
MPAKRLAIIGNQAFAMRNFRTPLIEALVARSVEVVAFAPDYDDLDRKAMAGLGAKAADYPLKRAGISPLGDITTIFRLVKELRQFRPDTVLSFSAKPSIYGTLAAWIAGVPHRYALIEGLGHAFLDRGDIRGILLRETVSWLYRIALFRTDKTLFLNSDDLCYFVDSGLVRANKAEKVGAIGVDLDVWRATPTVLRPLTFLFIGRLLREKGIVEFMDAARRLKRSHPDTRFVVLGAPDSNPSSVTAQQMQHWVRDGTVEWPGQVDVMPWLATASVFVLPSYREGVPRSTQEAMAMGRAVITTDVPGCRDTVVDGTNGILIPARDTDALYNAMRRLALEPALISMMGLRSRQFAELWFDVRRANETMIAALDL